MIHCTPANDELAGASNARAHKAIDHQFGGHHCETTPLPSRTDLESKARARRSVPSRLPCKSRALAVRPSFGRQRKPPARRRLPWLLINRNDSAPSTTVHISQCARRTRTDTKTTNRRCRSPRIGTKRDTAELSAAYRERCASQSPIGAVDATVKTQSKHAAHVSCRLRHREETRVLFLTGRFVFHSYGRPTAIEGTAKKTAPRKKRQKAQQRHRRSSQGIRHKERARKTSPYAQTDGVLRVAGARPPPYWTGWAPSTDPRRSSPSDAPGVARVVLFQGRAIRFHHSRRVPYTPPNL
jgi:hypothetical protein